LQHTSEQLLTTTIGSFVSKFLLLGGSFATAFAEDRLLLFRKTRVVILGPCCKFPVFRVVVEAFRLRPDDSNLRPALLCIREAVLHGAEGGLIVVAASVERLLLMREVIVLVQLPMRLTILEVGDCMAY
jgi:hypothetical protein